MDDRELNAEELLADWVRHNFSTSTRRGILRIRRAEPRPATRNFFQRFKLETAEFDGTGRNPANVTCTVLEVSETDQRVIMASGTACDSIPDL
jgi:hypothetical protein